MEVVLAGTNKDWEWIADHHRACAVVSFRDLQYVRHERERERERGKKHLSSSTSIITSNFMSHRWKRFYAVSLPRGCHPEVYHEFGRMWAENLSGFRETTHQSFETDEEATELPEALHELGWMWAANLPGFRETTHQSFETDEEATELLVAISLGTEL